MNYFHRLEDIPVHAHPIAQIKVLSGAQSMVFWSEVKAGEEAPMHSHPQEQIVWVMSGRIDYKVGDAPIQSCGPGAVILIPGDTPHHAWYREDCRVVEFFSPPRLDLFPAAANSVYALD